MAFGALRSTFRRPEEPAPALADGSPIEFEPGTADPTADGAAGAAAFPCPSCGRTLSRGTRRCSDCKQALILDVSLDRAGKLAGAGAAAGVLVTLLLVNLFAPARPAATLPTDASAGGGTGVSAPSVPAAAAAALRGTTAINGRLAAEAEGLASELAAKRVDPAEVAKIMRRMTIDTRAGSGMVGSLAAWPEAAGQQAALAALYEDLGNQLDKGLGASLKSTGAYKKSAKSILSTLRRIPEIDASARSLATQGDVDLVPVSFPDELE